MIQENFHLQTLHNRNLRRPHTYHVQEKLVEFLSDKSLQLEFSKQSLCHFWIRIRNECPIISDLVIHKLLAFCTTYWCEAALSKLIIIKSKNRSFLKNVENDLRPALSCINLRMDDLCASIPLVVPDNVYKLNCILLLFFALKYPLRGSFSTVQLLSKIVCICMISP